MLEPSINDLRRKYYCKIVFSGCVKQYFSSLLEHRVPQGSFREQAKTINRHTLVLLKSPSNSKSLCAFLSTQGRLSLAELRVCGAGNCRPACIFARRRRAESIDHQVTAFAALILSCCEFR
jgi:hypothetical protein